MIRLGVEEMKRVKTFTYLGSTLAEDGELDAEVNHRVQSGWRHVMRRDEQYVGKRVMGIEVQGSRMRGSPKKKKKKKKKKGGKKKKKKKKKRGGRRKRGEGGRRGGRRR